MPAPIHDDEPFPRYEPEVSASREWAREWARTHAENPPLNEPLIEAMADHVVRFLQDSNIKLVGKPLDEMFSGNRAEQVAKMQQQNAAARSGTLYGSEKDAWQ